MLLGSSPQQATLDDMSMGGPRVEVDLDNVGFLNLTSLKHSYWV